MPAIIRRAEWGARQGPGNATNGAKLHLFVHHSAVPRPGDRTNEADERTEVRNMESFHAGGLTVANPRIGYTFLIAPSGRVYEGTGWGRVGAHTRDRNSSSYGTCLMMDGRVTPATAAAIDAFDALRADGVRLGHLAADHTVRGHRERHRRLRNLRRTSEELEITHPAARRSLSGGRAALPACIRICVPAP